MKRSWLIGAALLFSLSAVACSDDDDSISGDAAVVKHDGGSSAIVDGGLDGSVGLDSGTTDAGESDGGDSGL